MIELTPPVRRLVGIARTLPPEVMPQLTDYAEFLGEKYGRIAVDEVNTWTPADDEVDLGNPGYSGFNNDAVDLSGVIPTRILNGYGGHSAIGLI